MHCAQCYPRLACPLLVSLFMQLHDGPQTAPALGRQGDRKGIIGMQIHAPYACMLKMRGPPEKNQQKAEREGNKKRPLIKERMLLINVDNYYSRNGSTFGVPAAE